MDHTFTHIQCIRSISSVELDAKFINGTSGKMTILTPIDIDCHCKCKTKKEDCLPNQQYDSQSCSCRCPDKIPNWCQINVLHRYDPWDCQCHCLNELEKCSTGTRFNEISCQ